jgi:uncharacterized protein (TIGR00730 family)
MARGRLRVLFARQSREQASAPQRSICVFCGSHPGNDPAFVAAAEALGAALARESLGLVYGGGSFGLMGVIARATKDAGGHVVGIIPTSLIERERPPAELHELVITTSMHERKQAMFDRSSAFVALPGGLGTLDETVEQMTWLTIGHHRKPIIFLNVEGYWDPVLTMFERMQASDFLGSDLEIGVVRHAAEVIPAIKDFWDQETRDRIGIAPAISEMIEAPLNGEDEALIEAIRGKSA